MSDFYNTLGVSREAEDVVIRAAYKALAQKYHPDKWRHNPKLSNERMSEINRAYEILSDSNKRNKYNRDNKSGQEIPIPEQKLKSKNKYIFALQYIFPILIVLIICNYYTNLTKEKPVNISSKFVEIGGIKNEDLLGIQFTIDAMIDTNAVLYKIRQKALENYKLKYQKKYIEDEKLDEIERMKYLIKKDELIYEIFYESIRSGIDPTLAFGLIEQISNFQNMFRDGRNDARGLMGVKKSFPENYRNIDSNYLYVAKINLRYGLAILHHLIEKRKGDLTLALGDYYDINIYIPKDPSMISKEKFIEQVLAKQMYWSNGRKRFEILHN